MYVHQMFIFSYVKAMFSKKFKKVWGGEINHININFSDRIWEKYFIIFY